MPVGVLDAKLPPIPVDVMKPESHVRGAGSFRTDLVPWILKINLLPFEMSQCFSKGSHVRQMKRHVVECCRHWLAFEKGDCDVVVANRDAVFKFELLFQPDRTLEPLCTFLGVAYRQSKMSDYTEGERGLHPSTLACRCRIA